MEDKLNGARENKDFCEAWLQYTEGQPTARIYREWAGVMAISGALTRRVWIHTSPSMPYLFPNLFTMLVGDPGAGKDIAINRVRKLWFEASFQADSTQALNIAAQSLSAKGLVDALAHDNAKLFIDLGSKRESFQSVLICTPELGTLVPEYNPSLIANMCDLYNCNDTFGDQVRNGKGEAIVIDKPHLAVLIGGTPSFLVSAFPEEAFEMGFFSRTILIYTNERTRSPMYADEAKDKAIRIEANSLWAKLVSDIKQIAHLAGQFKVPADVRRVSNNFHERECDETAIQYSRFRDYNTRRSLHVQKLAMCFSVSHSSDLVITMEDWERALALLLKTEKLMPNIFANIRSSRGFHSTIEEVLQTGDSSRVLTEAQIIRQIRRKHAPHEVPQIIQSMLTGGDLEVVREDKGVRVFRVKGNLPNLKLVKGE
jgi:hypothetical protein